MSEEYSIASDTIRKKEKLTKRLRRRLSIAPSVSPKPRSKHSHSNNGYNNSSTKDDSKKGGMVFVGATNPSMDESVKSHGETSIIDGSAIQGHHQRTEQKLRRRRKFISPSSIPEMVSMSARDDGLLRKIVTSPIKTALDVGYKNRDKSSVQPEVLTQKVAVSDIERMAQKSGKNSAQERFRVKPDYAYPRVKFNRDELRKEANKKSSYFHDLRGQPPNPAIIGSFYLEILQCFGIPRFGDNILRETSAFCLAVCGSSAFQTDVMPPVANPMWLSKMRRACIFPLYEGYATIYVGCFAHQNLSKDLFIGRIAIDVAKLRQGCTYDITLPLRKSAVIYSREQRGAMRVRFHLDWKDERKVLLSYIPKELPSFRPLDKVSVKCVDNKAFQNVARVVHGHDIPLKFSMKLVKATIREADFVQVHVLRYMKKRTLRNLRRWEYPLISGFVFCAWMHAVYHATTSYIPGHIVTFVLLHVTKNYTRYVLDGNYDNGFTAPTWEELVMALAMGKEGRKIVEPLEMARKDQNTTHSIMMSHLDDEHENGQEVTLQTIAASFREGVKTVERKKIFGNVVTSFVGTEAVDFLVENDYASTRQEAVALGVRLEKECRLFEHSRRKYPFKDADLTYVFLNFDTSEYIFKTHKPWFKRWMRLLGFKRVQISPEEAHMEMPFASGTDHPRFSVKDSLVIRSKESRSMLQKESEVGDEDDVHDFGITKFRSHIESANRIPGSQIPNQVLAGTNQVLAGTLAGTNQMLAGIAPKSKNSKLAMAAGIVANPGALAKTLDVIDTDTCPVTHSNWDTGDAAPLVTVKQLKGPPCQDIDFEGEGGDKKIPEKMAEIRKEIHDKTGNIFNVLPYRLSLDGAEWEDEQGRSSRSKLKSKRKGIVRSLSPPRRLRKKNSKMDDSRRPTLRNLPKLDKLSVKRVSKGGNGSSKSRKKLDVHEFEFLAKRKEEYDRLLQLLRHSHSNIIISKIAAILAPLLDVAQMFLSMFRFSFNLMTWRDPSLTFWFVVIGWCLVFFLHLFPWRLFFLASGIAFVGPQNWVMRVLKEKKEGKEIFDDDQKTSKRRPTNENRSSEHASCFSSFAPDNRVVRESQIDTSTYMEVAVPTTPICFRRFYDWPPEPEYARVVKCAPPENDYVAQQLLENDTFELFEGDCEYDDESVISEKKINWKKKARKIAKKVTPRQARRMVKNVASSKGLTTVSEDYSIEPVSA